MARSTYRQPSFFRLFAGQLFLLACAIPAATWISLLYGVSVVSLVAIGFVLLGVVSILGPARVIAAQVTVDANGIAAKRYLGSKWTCTWTDLLCIGEFEIPTFGALRRLKLESRTDGTIYISDVMANYDDLLEQINRYGGFGKPPCSRPSLLTRLLTG